ncbi:MAG: hypothetical protein WAK93_05380 [Solirubrobacteraceae bacterium]
MRPTFEYMRLSASIRGFEATGPGSEKFADVQGFDAMLAALGADGWELVTAQAADSARTYLFKRQTDLSPSSSVRGS